MGIVRIVLVATCLLAATIVQASTTYHMSRLGRLEGDGHSSATRINSAGQILGSSIPYGSNDMRGAFLWDHTSGMVDIRVEGQFDLPGGINNNGQVVGTAAPGYGPSTAVLREANGELIQLDPITTGAYGTYASALNNDGWVVGSSGNYAVLWQGSIAARMIGGAASSYSYATDINNNGSIAWVESLRDDGQWIGTRSYVWSQGGSTLLQPLNEGDNCQVESINDSSILVGSSGNHAVVWGIDGSVIVDLGVGTAYGINNHGQIVGYVGDSARLWNMDGSIAADLGMLAGANTPSLAYGINDSGQIVGAAGYDEYQNMEAVLWEPVPEPSSVLALAGGMACLAGMFKRRRS